MQVAAPKFTVLYNNRNITKDIARYMLSISYNDKTAGESDEVEIELEDTDQLWQNSWYPEKGANLTVTIEGLKCGVFELDEVELKGPPDTVTIRGMATGLTTSLRTKKSDAHENKTLKQIAEKVASKNNLTVQGDVPDISIGRVTQMQETDLKFLKRISKDYGVMFSVRGTVIVFTSIYSIEGRAASLSVDKSDISGYSFKDKADGMIKDAKVASKNSKKNSAVSTNLDFEKYKSDNPAYSAPAVTNQDSGVQFGRTENTQQAEAKAKAVMHLSASNQQEGVIAMQGNILACAGNNINVSGFGRLSGKFHIKASSHKIDKSGGYTTECEIKRLQEPTKAQQVSKPVKKQQVKDVPVRKTGLTGKGMESLDGGNYLNLDYSR